MNAFKRFSGKASWLNKRFLLRNPVWNVVLWTVVFNVFCVALIWDERARALRQAESSSSNLVAAAGRDISRTIEIIDLTIQKIIERINKPEFSGLDRSVKRQLLIDQVATAQYFLGIGVADGNGVVLFHSRVEDPSFINVEKNDYFRVHKDPTDVGLYISLPIKSPYGYGTAIVFSRRLSNSDGSFGGIAYVALGLDYFRDLFERMDLGKNGSISLMRADGRLLVREPYDEADLGADVSSADIYRHYPKALTGSFKAEASPIGKVARLYTFGQVGKFPITISVGRTLQDIYEDWWDRAATVGLILLVLTGGMIALAYNLRRELQRRRAAHQEALHNAALFRGVMKGAGIGAALLKLDGTAFMVNPAFCRLLGYSDEELLLKPIRDLIYPGDDIPDDGPLLSGKIAFSESEHRYVRKDGTIVYLQRSSSVMRDEGGKPLYFIVQFQDVTARREAETRLRYNATHDDLTGLLNRAAFEEKLQKAVWESRETGIRHVLAFLDLDRLKIINDSAGHVAGDALLRSVAGTLPLYLRKNDVVGRLGGDEFGIILMGCSLEEATKILERLNTAAGLVTFPWGDRSYSVGASVGITEINPASFSASSLLAQADIACLTAKMAGRNRVSIYDPEQSEAVERHRELSVAAEIREAISQGRLRLYAQRIVSCSGTTSDSERYEVLVRMVDQAGAIIPPSIFIPAAERYDLIGDLDRWVIGNTLEVARDLIAKDKGARIHINLSARSLGDQSFLAYVMGAIGGSGVSPSNLVFEITETALISNMALAATIVCKLREIGCQIALDDFGAGLSSFNYLRSFPVDIVKIDGSFVRNMTSNAVDRHIVRSIHQIAYELGAKTVAEYVEDEASFNMVSALGITFAQGYALHEPEPFGAAMAQARVRL